MLKLRRKDVHCTVSMRNSTGSPLFSDFKSDLSRVVRFRPLVKGNEDPGYEGGGNPILYFFYSLVRMTVTQYTTTLQNGLLKIQENEENEIKYISFIRVIMEL